MSHMNAQKTPKVAILGHRGIPSSYGGFETFAEKLAEGLVGLGVFVTSYCRSNYFKDRPKEYKGVALRYLSTPPIKSLETIIHTGLSVCHGIITNVADVFVIVNVGNAPWAGLAKVCGKKVIFCVDGLDWERKKWGRFARAYLQACSWLARFVANEVITDAGSVKEFYEEKRNTKSRMIPYGTEIEINPVDLNQLAELKLEPKKYFVYVARFEPENNPLLVVKAYVASGSTLPLVMIGDNRYRPKYVEEIKQAANERVLFLGYVFGARYKQLLRNALAYIRAAEVGGISPAVIEAMGRGVCVIANDKPENREPLADTGIFYNLSSEDLARTMSRIDRNQSKAIELGKAASQRALIVYSWDRIAYEYYKIIKSLSRSISGRSRPKIEKRKSGKPTIVVTGAGGMLGKDILAHFSNEYKVIATTQNPFDVSTIQLDVTNFDAFERIIALYKPAYIFHLAALTDLEKCEKNVNMAYAVNAQATKNAAQIARKYGAKLVYVSSSNVFDGSKQWFTEDDEPRPINVYGLTKYVGELMVKYYATDYIIIRLGWLMGGGPLRDTKFVAKIVDQIVGGKKELHALSDKFGTVSYTRDVALQLETLLNNKANGIFHLTSAGRVSRFELAKEIVQILGCQGAVTVTPVEESFFSHTFTTQRSGSECLKSIKLKEFAGNKQNSWQTALSDYLTKDFAFAFHEKSDEIKAAKAKLA